MMMKFDEKLYKVLKGGPVYGLDLGAHFFSRFRTSYYIGAGFLSQRIYREFELWDWNGPTGVFVSEHRTFNRTTLTIGIAF